MNPFQVNPSSSPGKVGPLPGQEQTAVRLARLHADLVALSADLDLSARPSATIVGRPDGLVVVGKRTEGDMIPLLSAALVVLLERNIAVTEQVRARMPPTWKRLLGLG